MQMSEFGAKKKILKVVEQLPDDATIEDAIERLYFLAKIDLEGREVRLSDEHTESDWYLLGEALTRLPFEGARGVLRDAALQFVRKVSGYRKPARRNEEAFEAAVTEITGATRRLFDQLVPSVPRACART